MKDKKWVRPLVFIVCGMVVGWAYAYFIGCGSGCSIRSNPWIMAPYTGVIGFLLSVMTKKKETQKEEQEDEV